MFLGDLILADVVGHRFKTSDEQRVSAMDIM